MKTIRGEDIMFLSAKPECTTDPECPDHLACVNEKCTNPCFTSTCGVNAQCQPKNHRAVCVCNPGFVGDPYRICEERKISTVSISRVRFLVSLFS